jgi:glutaredoxin 3
MGGGRSGIQLAGILGDASSGWWAQGLRNGTGRTMDKADEEPMERRQIVMYVSAGCSYAWRAKRLLTAKGYAFEIVDVTFDRRMRAWLAEQTGQRTIPQIKIGQRWVGGFDEISALDARGELDRIVAGAA